MLALNEELRTLCVVRRGDITGLSTGGGATVWAGTRARHIVEAIERGRSDCDDGIHSEIFIQYVKFYLLGIGKLSRSIDYSSVLARSDLKWRPEAVSFIVTKLCNFRCPHCYNGSGLSHPNELSYREKLAVVEYLGKWGVPRLILCGGEPTVEPALRDILEIARRYRMKVKLTTNGWNIPAFLFDAVAAHVVTQVNLSLDGATAIAHDGLRGRAGSFSRVMRSLKQLRNSSALVVLNSCVASGRVQEMEAVVQLAIEIGCGAVSFKALLASGRPDSSVTARALSFNEMALFQAERERLGARYRNQLSIDGALITDRVPTELLDNVSCNAATTAMTINADGTMLPCEIISSFANGPNIRHVPAAQAWVDHAVFSSFRSAKLGLSGGCGTAGCPGSKMAPQSLLRIV
jgi:MoaA/NifB/PqqE/SkfB family radical SAM enzyme